MSEPTRLYPTWICHECAIPITNRIHKTIWSWCEDECGWCGEWKAVTRPRNYGWPDPPPVPEVSKE